MVGKRKGGTGGGGQNHTSAPREVDIVELLAVVWRAKWLVVIATATFLVGSLLALLILPPRYEATATVIPITSDVAGASQYAAFATLAGINLPAAGTSTPSQKILAVLKSRTLRERLVGDLSLVPVLAGKTWISGHSNAFNAAVRRLEARLSVTEQKSTGVIEVRARFHDPATAEAVANRAVKILEEILNEKNFTIGKMSSASLLRQIDKQASKLSELERRLALFQKRTRLISPEGQVTSAIGLYADLLQRRVDLDVKLLGLENALSSDNPRIMEAKAERRAVTAEIEKIEGSIGLGTFSMENAPAQIAEYETISRELEIAAKIYSGLLATYENQKLQVAEDQLFVEVIDPAIRPDLEAKPPAPLFILAATLVGFVSAVIGVLVLNAVRTLGREIAAKITTPSTRGARSLP